MTINLAYIRSAIRPKVGRFSESQMQRLGQVLRPPGFFAWGPFIVLLDLPERFQKKDQDFPLEEINKHLAEFTALIQAETDKFTRDLPN